MLLIISNSLIILACVIIMICAIGFSKTKDVFCSTHLIVIANIYGISFLLIGLMIREMSLFVTIKIIVLIILNAIITIIISQGVPRRAMINKIVPNAEVKKETKELGKKNIISR